MKQIALVRQYLVVREPIDLPIVTLDTVPITLIPFTQMPNNTD